MGKYSFKKDIHGYSIIEDGHTMFAEDVIKRLKRLEYLEKQHSELAKKDLISEWMFEIK